MKALVPRRRLRGSNTVGVAPHITVGGIVRARVRDDLGELRVISQAR